MVLDQCSLDPFQDSKYLKGGERRPGRITYDGEVGGDGLELSGYGDGVGARGVSEEVEGGDGQGPAWTSDC